MAEALIRQRVEDYTKAVRAKDIDRVMSLYAPNIVSFDVNPPLRYAGTDNKHRAWQDFIAAYTGPVAYEVRDLNVTTDGELAFVHGLNHVKGTLASGHIADLWVRWTACLRRIDGIWLVVHDHVSVPADLEHGQAVGQTAQCPVSCATQRRYTGLVDSRQRRSAHVLSRRAQSYLEEVEKARELLAQVTFYGMDSRWGNCP